MASKVNNAIIYVRSISWKINNHFETNDQVGSSKHVHKERKIWIQMAVGTTQETFVLEATFKLPNFEADEQLNLRDEGAYFMCIFW